MSQEYPVSWLFLLFNLPAKHSRDRVKVWRRLKKFGAIQLKTSTYVLPDEPVHYERLQSLAKEIVDNGGESALVRVKEIEGMPYAALVAMFNEARAREYEEIAEPLALLIRDTRARKTSPEAFTNQLQKLHKRFQEIYDIDFFERQNRSNPIEESRREKDACEPRNIRVEPGLSRPDLRSIVPVRLGWFTNSSIQKPNLSLPGHGRSIRAHCHTS